MEKNTRILLLIWALILGCLTSFAIVAFGMMTEPEEVTALSIVFAIIFGSIVSLPLWLPAIIPSRFKVLFVIIRWICATVLVYPTYLFSGIIENFITRLVQDKGPSFEGLFVGVLLTGLCFAGILVLTWPELRQLISKPSFKLGAEPNPNK